MSELAKLSNEQLLAKWQDQQLSAIEQQEFEQRQQLDAEFAETVATAIAVQSLSKQSNTLPPPKWDKAASIAFARTDKHTPFRWLPLAAMAMSTAAMLMVLTGFQVQSTNGNLAMGFNLSPSTQDVAVLVDEKIAEYQRAQQAINAQYISALQSQNAQSNSELTRYLLETSRVERREDFAELIKFINEQRDDDQRFYARQFNKLETEIISSSLQE